MWIDIIDRSIAYLASLKSTDGIPLLQTRRKTFVQGFIIAAKSIKLLALNLLQLDIRPFQYVLTYKLSQDHLELLFCLVRSMNGWCRNPTIVQFISAMKRILLRASLLTAKSGNCVVFETDESPAIFSLKWTKNRRGDKPESIDEDIPEYLLAIDMEEDHSIFKKNILAHIGGFICRSMRNNISCETCSEALLSDDKSGEDFALIREKDNGALVYPSHDVLRVLSIAENVFKQYCIKGLMSPSCPGLRSKMKIRVMHELYDTAVFSCLHQHDIQNHCPLEDMHSTQITKTIAHKYFDMRLFRYQQKYNDDVLHKGKVGKRQKLNKSLIFSGL